MSDLNAKRPHYDEAVGTTSDGQLVFWNDLTSKFVDDTISAIDDIDASAEIGVGAELTSNTAITANTTTVLTGWTEQWDLGSDFASGVFTAPRDGRYRIHGVIRFAGGADQDRIRAIIRKNSTGDETFYQSASGVTTSSIVFTKSYSLVESDTLDVAALNVDSNDTIQASDTALYIEYLDKSVAATPNASGTVTSVAINPTDGIQVDGGSPITTTGTITLGMNPDVSAFPWSIDEDNMVSDSATKAPTQQSVKAYVDTRAPSLTSGSVAFSDGTNLTQDNANFFFDDTNNRLGVGTNAPLQTLHLTSSTTQAGFQCHNSTTGTTATDGFAFGQVGGSTVLVNYEVGNMGLYTAGTERLTIDSVGNVGINDTTPTEKLEVGGNIAVTGTVDGRDIATDGGKLDNITIGTAGSIAFSDGTLLTQDNANLFWDNTNDRLGLGTNTPSAVLDVTGAGGVSGGAVINSTNETVSMYFETDLANSLYIIGYNGSGSREIQFTHDGNVILTSASSKNVGLGESAPDTKLHVDGAITQNPLSADPANPDTGNSIMWVSDGTGSGDAGDVMMKINVGGTTKTITLVDYSTF